MRILPLLAAIALLSGCGREQTPEEKAREEARAVAMVEAAQKRLPPLLPITPEPFRRADLAEAGLSTAGCDFLPSGGATDAIVFHAGDTIGTLRHDGRFQRVAADSGSARLPGGGFVQYAGKTHSLQIVLLPATPGAIASGTGRAAVLTLRDAWDRPVYSAPGVLACGG